ncbi:substrate-binding periplasmic protein [Roseateles sp. NT4]|uniref:substrate-binding periplasmic protein n=1 Tax=Roseateles sp. NT4 TaxID=3453715 RepID=UPI003EEAA5B0
MRKAALLSLLLPLAATVQAEAVDMVVYPNAGVFDADGSRIVGPGADMLARLQMASGVQMSQQLMPIARAMQTVPHKPGSCLVALPRTPEREAQYRWAGPWATSAIGLYGGANETRHVEGPADLRGAQIAVLRESTPAAWLKEQGLTGHEVNDVTIGLRMLQAGRVDFWLGNDLAARFVIRNLSGPVPRLLYSFGRIDLYMACHLATPAETLERLQAGFDQLRRNGDLAEFGLR